MRKYQIGDVVHHDFSQVQGTVTDIRDDAKYTTYVKWDSAPERNDWYDPQVLVPVRTSYPQVGSPVVTLAMTQDGAIGISNSTQTSSETPNIDKDTNYPFGN